MFKATAQAVMASLMVATPAIVNAAGFAVVEQNGSRLGTAYAGGAAEASDASVLLSNPAGMVHLVGRQLSISGVAFLPKIEFTNDNSMSAAGTPMSGANGGNAAKTSFIPNLYFVDSLGNGMKYGLSVTAPAGVKIKNGSDWVGRYFSSESMLEVVDISPAFAANVGSGTAIGVALNIQYARAKQAKAIDFGTACYGIAPAAFCGSQGLFPQGADGMAEVNGHDWSAGYHVGIQHDLTPHTRLGLMYRSKVAHKIDGATAFSKVPAFLADGFQGTRTQAEITLPEVISLSAVHKATSALTLMGDASWTRWSRFNELRIHFDTPPLTGDDITTEAWRNSWRFAFGTEYRYSGDLTLRAGIARDQSPIVNGFRTPAIPDSSRNSLAFGIGYKVSKTGSLDLGYTHLFIAKGDVNLSSPSQGNLKGRYNNTADVLGVQYNVAF